MAKPWYETGEYKNDKTLMRQMNPNFDVARWGKYFDYNPQTHTLGLSLPMQNEYLSRIGAGDAAFGDIDESVAENQGLFWPGHKPQGFKYETVADFAEDYRNASPAEKKNILFWLEDFDTPTKGKIADAIRGYENISQKEWNDSELWNAITRYNDLNEDFSVRPTDYETWKQKNKRAKRINSIIDNYELLEGAIAGESINAETDPYFHGDRIFSMLSDSAERRGIENDVTYDEIINVLRSRKRGK